MVTHFRLFAVLAGVAIAGCAPTIDRAEIQARPGQPLSAAVAPVTLPYEAGKPTAVVIVEPVVRANVSPDVSPDLTIRIDNERANLSQKLVSVLARSGNIAVLDARAMRAGTDGTYRTGLGAQEKGPFLIRPVLTEFSELAEESSDGLDISLGWIGVGAGIAGLVTGKPGLAWSGLGVALADPQFSNGTKRRTGNVSFDIQIVDGRTLRIIDAFQASGTFSAESAQTSFSLFGITDTRSDFAQSVLGQAAQAALNDAAVKIRAALI